MLPQHRHKCPYSQYPASSEQRKFALQKFTIVGDIWNRMPTLEIIHMRQACIRVAQSESTYARTDTPERAGYFQIVRCRCRRRRVVKICKPVRNFAPWPYRLNRNLNQRSMRFFVCVCARTFFVVRKADAPFVALNRGTNQCKSKLSEERKHVSFVE